MSSAQLPETAKATFVQAAGDFSPATFLERGVSVPFTTPQLAGARVRRGKRDPLELIIPNPSGAGGFGVMGWHAIGELCQPTLHDRTLSARIATLDPMAPSAMSQLVLEVAAEGLAGPDAALAAVAAQEAEAGMRARSNFELLMLLVQQSEESKIGDPGMPLEARARRVIGVLGPKLAATPELVESLIGKLAVVFASIGVGPNADRARVPAAIAVLEEMRDDINAWRANPALTSGADAALVAGTSALIIGCARKTVADARALTSDMAELLRRWIADPKGVAEQLARAEWLLDGWHWIAALWMESDARIDAAVTDIADLVSVLPREMERWMPPAAATVADAFRRRRKSVRRDDWRTGPTPGDLIARNERLLACMARAVAPTLDAKA